MKLLKFLLAGALAIAVTSGTAFAGSASTPMNITGNVVGSCSISTTDLDVGSHTKEELLAMTFPKDLIVNCSNGAAYTVYIDNPGIPWSLNGGNAKNVAGGAGTVWLKAYRSDGTTGMSPVAGWSRSGTGADETVQVVLQVLPQGTYFGSISGTIQPTVQW